MPTLTPPPPIRVTFTPEISATLRRRAKARKMTLSQIVAAIVEDYIDDEEDKYLSKIADERATKSTGTVTLADAWKQVNAL